MVKLICLVYALNNKQARELANIKTHDIRGLAASWARGSVSLESVMEACSWKAHNTFTDFYLKDLTLIRDDLLSLGPLSVAQTVVVPPHSS